MTLEELIEQGLSKNLDRAQVSHEHAVNSTLLLDDQALCVMARDKGGATSLLLSIAIAALKEAREKTEIRVSA